MAKNLIRIDNKYECPICGSTTLEGKSRQVSQDSCEMWFECAKCGYDTSPRDHVETVMGWRSDLKECAVELWQSGITAWLYGDELESMRVAHAKIERMLDKAIDWMACGLCPLADDCVFDYPTSPCIRAKKEWLEEKADE